MERLDHTRDTAPIITSDSCDPLALRHLDLVLSPRQRLLGRTPAAPHHDFFLLLLLLLLFILFFTYSRGTSSLPSCLWSLRIFPPLPGSRLTIYYRDASSALLQLVKQWLNFTYSRSHAFRYERKNTNPTLVRIELTTSALAGVQVTY